MNETKTTAAMTAAAEAACDSSMPVEGAELCHSGMFVHPGPAPSGSEDPV